MSNDDEIRPYLVYRASGKQFECALWTLESGAKSLALFLTREAASSYLDSAGLRPVWKELRPAKAELERIFEHCIAAGIEYAVLEPTNQQDGRLFDLREVLAEMKAATKAESGKRKAES
jgi:hypothetical protein